MNYIELFAGCGGLSLGLNSAGFTLVMANELSPMASETYAYNFFKEDLSKSKNPKKSNVLWLSSQFERSEINERIRENPQFYPKQGEGFSDLTTDTSLLGKLIIGDIKQLNSWLSQNPHIQESLQSGFATSREVDLISGGPPCQSFSMAGLRDKDNSRNTLPFEFAEFVNKVRPRLVLLENVTGILKAFTKGTENYYAWYEVAKTFSSIGYIPLCLHVNAKYVGVAQSRPRFILIGIREDLYENNINNFNESEKILFEKSESFHAKVKENKYLDFGFLNYFDIEKNNNFELFKNSFLQPLTEFYNKPFSVYDAINDLKSEASKTTETSKYVHYINKNLNQPHRIKDIQNHIKRNNGLTVQKRFRLYQITNLLTIDTRKEINNLLKEKQNSISDESLKELLKYDFLIEEGQYAYFTSRSEFLSYISELKTKKRSQKALDETAPAPAALSIPDDFCHYDHNELRTLTVREMARIQSFPDGFIFRSKITTGGTMRRFEVPQYTQVGNAVPPLLGLALGKVIIKLSDKIMESPL